MSFLVLCPTPLLTPPKMVLPVNSQKVPSFKILLIYPKFKINNKKIGRAFCLIVLKNSLPMIGVCKFAGKIKSQYSVWFVFLWKLNVFNFTLQSDCLTTYPYTLSPTYPVEFKFLLMQTAGLPDHLNRKMSPSNK